ncbi:carbohydrate ABC transporter permease [Cohnella cellulosilytica]|uniref:Carbohydrate ABC transporter permease n=1 Tax=Cohnella cellulosilytica TaxID=986710 RepID=A0ABW2F3R1_9BACL
MATAQTGRTGTRLNMSRRSTLNFHLYTSPWVIGFLVFTLGPMVYSLYLSFTDAKMGSGGNFVGFKNYAAMFTNDDLFFKSLGNTAVYAVVSIALGLLFSFLLACLLNCRLKGVGIFRTLYYIPSVISGVSTILLWGWIFNPSYGLLNYSLSLMGIEGPGWLSDPHWAMSAVIFMSFWSIGGNIVIFLAGLQDIPQELYECAALDGAGIVARTVRITVPMISPVLLFNLIMGIIGGLQVFNQPYILTQGGPNHATYTYVMHLFANAFQYFKVGYGTSLAWILFLITLLLSMIVIRTSNYWVFYSGGDD